MTNEIKQLIINFGKKYAKRIENCIGFDVEVEKDFWDTLSLEQKSYVKNKIFETRCLNVGSIIIFSILMILVLLFQFYNM